MLAKAELVADPEQEVREKITMGFNFTPNTKHLSPFK
jgi:hypothetical protein